MAVTDLAEFTLKNTRRTNRNGPIRWILSHASRHWALLLVASGGALGNAALMGISSVLIGQAFSVMLAEEPQLAQLGQIALIIALAQLTRGALQFCRNFGFELIAQRVERNVRDELYGSLLGKSMTFHNLQPVGDTMARATNDVREVNFLFSPGLNMVIGSFMFLIMPIILTPGRYHPSLLLVPCLFVVVYFYSLRGYLRRLSPITDEVRESFGELNTRLNEALDGIETVKGSAKEASEVKLFEKNANRYRNAVVSQGNEEARFVPLLIFSVALAGGLLHAFILYQQGLLADVGEVVGYFGLLMMLDFPTFTSLWAYSQIASGLAGARRILELMNRENNLDQNKVGYAGDMRGDLAFEDVCFSYPDLKEENHSDCTLQNISFTVKAGKTVAIVGQTGSGKTSLAKLINRIYDVTDGRVLVDGVDVRQWNLETLRRGISIIEQDVFLFSDTIAQNIAFGKPGASDEEIVAAAKAAQAHEFIAAFKDGYKTVIGERGVTLSGGQRQRLALARAFLTDPRILILDDSTSAIDSATEDKIQRAIFNAAMGRTTIIITHRLSQIRWADLIIVMRQGFISAIGSHDELMASSEAYRRIFSES